MSAEKSEGLKRLVKGGARPRLGSLKEEDTPSRSGQSSFAGARQNGNTPSTRNVSGSTSTAAEDASKESAAAAAKPPARKRFMPKVPAARVKQEEPTVQQSSSQVVAGMDELEAAATAQAERQKARKDRMNSFAQQDGKPRVSFGKVSTLGPSAGPTLKGLTGISGGSGASGGSMGANGAQNRGQSQRQMHAAGAHGDDVQHMDLDMPDAPSTEPEDDGIPFDLDAFYPTVLPLRPPEADSVDRVDASDDHAELELRAESPDEDMPGPSTAEELGLWADQGSRHRLMLMQLPTLLPKIQPPPKPPHSGPSPAPPPPGKHAASTLQQLGEGQIGKLLVFESGAVKLRIGDVLLDVSAGSTCECRQEVAIVSSAESAVTMLGHVSQTAVCTPDLDQLLGGGSIPDWPKGGVAPQHATRSNEQPGALSIKHETEAQVKAEPMDTS